MRGLAGVLVGVSLLCAAADARGAGTQESLFQDDDLLIHTSPAGADDTLDELRALGVDRVRLSVIWRDLAPAQRGPAPLDEARLSHLDHAVRAARARGIEVLLNVRGPAPAWAQPRAPGRLAGRDAYKPSPGEFARFVAAVGARYDGSRAELPRVSAWSIWNEPNWGGHLQPQSIRERRSRRLLTVAPRSYRRLYRAAHEALRLTGHAGDTILIGETAPIGNDKLGELSHLEPARFLRELFCLDRRLRPLRGREAVRRGCDFDRRGPLPATGYAHHPYSVTQPPWQPSADADHIMLADTGRLAAILDGAAAAGRLPARLPIWYTEFGYQTGPPDPLRGVSLEEQARWLAAAERMTASHPRVAAMTQFLLRDDEPRTSFSAGDPRHWLTYQTGLRFADGAPKPAYEAYRLPAAVAGGVLWGMVRPGENGVEQRVRIQRRADSGQPWTTVRERWVDHPRGYFTEPLPDGAGGEYRFQWVGSRAASRSQHR